MRPHMTKEQRTECVALYLTGETLDNLADRYDRDRTIINRLIGRMCERRGHRFRKPWHVKYYGVELGLPDGRHL